MIAPKVRASSAACGEALSRGTPISNVIVARIQDTSLFGPFTAPAYSTRNTSGTLDGPSAGGVTNVGRRPGGIHEASCSRELCLAVSGGLISVLEVVAPLWHLHWAGAKSGGSDKRRNVLQMMRTPYGWGAKIEHALDADSDASVDVDLAEDSTSSETEKEGRVPRGMAVRPNVTSSGVGLETPSNSVTDTTTDSDETRDPGDEAGIIVLCDGGWVGWYRSSPSFEVRLAVTTEARFDCGRCERPRTQRYDRKMMDRDESGSFADRTIERCQLLSVCRSILRATKSCMKGCSNNCRRELPIC